MPPTAAPTAHRVGEDVRVDEVRWKVLEAADLGQTLKSDDQFVEDKTTSGRFVRVRFELENLSKDMLTFVGLDLVDEQGRTFKPSSDVFQFIPNEEACVLENLNPNVDFFSASAYYTMGIPLDLFTPIFAIARIAGWTAHVMEQQSNNRIIRPTDEYTGPMGLKVTPIDQR